VSGGRPGVLVLVAGTGTEVGKTWVSARLLEAWRRAGLTAAARKPAQSFDPGTGPTDAEVLAAASGERPEQVCPPGRSYPVALAPPMAADALGLVPPTVAELASELSWPDGVDVGVVESAGGVRSPQADDGDVVELARALDPDAVVLVADAGLGTINAVRLAVGALAGAARPGRGALPVVVVLNRFDAGTDLHGRNHAWLAGRDGLDVVPGDPAGLALLATRLAVPARAGAG